MSIALITFLRLSILLLSGETSIRYFIWWNKVKRDPDTLLANLMLGIAIVHAVLSMMMGTSALKLFGFGHSKPEPALYGFYIAGLIAGTFFHLIPCWRISCGIRTPWIIGNLLIRLGIALVSVTAVELIR